jgi:hypothetical protein
VLPALVPFSIDIAATLIGQSKEYWQGDYSQVLEQTPIGLRLLQLHPLAFLAAAVVYAVTIATAIRWLPVTIAVWISLGYLIAHTSGVNSWIAWHPHHAILEPLHNMGASGFAAWCYLRYFRRDLVAL